MVQQFSVDGSVVLDFCSVFELRLRVFLCCKEMITSC